MRYMIVFAAILTGQAHAQFFGTGMVGGQQCPYNFGPGGGAMNPRDPLANLNSSITQVDNQLAAKQNTLNRINQRIEEAKAEIGQVIKSKTALGEIERHYGIKGGQDSYQSKCGGGKRRSGSGAGQRVNAMHRPHARENRSSGNESGLIPVPSEFCTWDEEKGKYMNDWQEVIAEDGKMMDDLCNYEIPLRSRPPETRATKACIHGLNKFYEKMAEKERVEQEITALKDRQDQMRSQLQDQQDRIRDRQERYQDAMAEGSYCPYCNQLAMQQTMQTSAGVMPFMNNGYNMMQYYNAGQRNYVMGRPMPPPQLPWRPPGPGMIRPGQPIIANPAYMTQPYAARIPGYAGVQPGIAPGQGIYGAGPGAMGPGAFGCQGTNMNGLGNNWAPEFMPFQNATANPWMNPYRMNPNQWNPNFRNGLLNPGFGPGWGPQVGNGVYDPRMALMMNNGGYGNFAPQFAPWNNPYANMYGNSMYPGYGNGVGYANGLGLGNGLGGPWYGNPNLGYGLGGQYNLGGYAPPIVNAPYGANQAVLNNYGYQMGLLKNQMGMISGLNAPAILPAPAGGGFGTIYNTPVQFPAPLPNVAVPPVGGQPAAPGAGGAPNVVVPRR